MTWEQTAAALAREVDRLQKENDRLRYGIEQMLSHAGQCEGVTNIMAVMARIEWIEGIGKELLSPALEGGGAANGGESQALQAAILGLHTLAGEFPTPMFETRKDYLQATISEINEIIGKQ